MFNLKNIKNKLKTKRGLDIKSETLYSYLVLDAKKYRLAFSIYLITAEQNSYGINPLFLISYKNRIVAIPIISNYYDLINDIGNRENLPTLMLVQLNNILFDNRELFYQYYNRTISRSKVINNFKF